jgi:HD-GYP domain-containing protein (c-di-GMP phosphodiesterase class II)
MVLGKSIYQLNGKLILGAGFRINAQMKAKLLERGFTHVYIKEEGTEDVVPEEIVSDEISFQAKIQLAGKIYDIQNHTDLKNASVSKAADLLESGYLKDVSLSKDIKKIVEEILKDITSAGAKLLNSVMIKTADTYFLDHALNVTILSILIGQMYRFSQKELLSLALGSFLHDIGKVVIEQMNESKDSKKAKELYTKHPTFGYLMLNYMPNISPLETQIINQHHENQDGSGFPNRLKGNNLPPIKSVDRITSGHIFRLAEVCSVANAFDNLTYNPQDREKLDPVSAMKQIILDGGPKYNKDVVKTLLEVVPYYPVGATIKVVDIMDPALIGHVGVVAQLHEDNINKPVIILTKNRYMKQIKPIIIDTLKLSKVLLKLVV